MRTELEPLPPLPPDDPEDEWVYLFLVYSAVGVARLCLWFWLWLTAVLMVTALLA